jgi:hypothetical protein
VESGIGGSPWQAADCATYRREIKDLKSAGLVDYIRRRTPQGDTRMTNPYLWGGAVLGVIVLLAFLRRFYKVKRDFAGYRQRVRDAQRAAMTTNSPSGKVPE